MFFASAQALAQRGDTLRVKSDTLATDRFQSQNIDIRPSKHSPKKAAWMSAALPGLGQVYNKKYWKVPVIYACVGGLAYSFQFNQSRYQKYRDAYKFRIDGDAATVDNYSGIYSDADLSSLYQYYKRYRDLTVIGFAAVYLLNVVDAAVDAHLYHFDVSDDLSLDMRPGLIPVSAGSYGMGMSLKVRF